jgi:glycine dehydrogenase subunit 1
MRYIPNTPEDRAEMLRAIGVSSFEDLVSSIPNSLRLNRPLHLAAGQSEFAVKALMTSLAKKNLNTVDYASFLGAGCYDHFVPSAVNTLAGRSEFATAYTPYQPEVAQGTLQVIYEFQSMVCELYGMEAANASMYDAGSALAEAVLLAVSQTGRKAVLCPGNVHGQYRGATKTLVTPLGIALHDVPLRDGRLGVAELERALDSNVAAVVLQYPNFFGIVEDIEPLIAAAHGAGALAIVVADPLAMGVLESPGALGADIVVGEGQSLGNYQSYGGPYLGLFATKGELVRRMPGRIAGVTKDVDGRRGFVLTLQTREQHIRREKATSNICTNEGLCATRATFFMAMLGPQGLRDVGDACLKRCTYLREQLSKIAGITLDHSGPHFKEFSFSLERDADEFMDFMATRGILAGVPLKWFDAKLEQSILVAVTETRTLAELNHYVAAVEAFVKGGK